jgi:hypothetical protein
MSTDSRKLEFKSRKSYKLFNLSSLTETLFFALWACYIKSIGQPRLHSVVRGFLLPLGFPAFFSLRDLRPLLASPIGLSRFSGEP